MKIEVNNVYQRKSISKPKVILVSVFILILLLILFGRLYYERTKINPIEVCVKTISNILVVKEQNSVLASAPIENVVSVDEGCVEENVQYIPNFTKESYNRINKIYNLSDDGQKIAYLTFDDGPSKDVTPLVLDVLKQENIKATFFVLGNNVDSNKKLVKRIYNEGHYIANHGYSHKYASIYKNKEAVLKEYEKCEKSIRNALEIPEYSTKLFRFPGGSSGGIYDDVKKETLKLFEKKQIGVMDWNCLTKDSEGNYTIEQLFKNFKSTSKGKNNLVILMHDAGGKILVPEVLKKVISYLKEEGYVFGDVRELVG